MTSMSPELPIVLAIHGSASTGKQWRPLQEYLSGIAQVIAPDLPGYGPAQHDQRDRKEVLNAALSACRQPVHVVAHSFGGAVALKLANDLPHRIASVTLFDPIAVTQSSSGQFTLPDPLDGLWRDLSEAEPERVMRGFVDYWSGGSQWRHLNTLQRDRLLEHFPGLCRDLGEVRAGHWAFPEAVFNGPITILLGEASPDIVQDMAQAVQHRHAQTTCKALVGLGHLAPLTSPEVVMPKIVSALNSHGLPMARPTFRALDRAA